MVKPKQSACFITTYATTRRQGGVTETSLAVQSTQILTRGNNDTATFNYSWRIDTLGSTLKLLPHYNRRQSDTPNNNFSCITTPESVRDSVYRDHWANVYNVTTATLPLEKHFSPRWSLRAGAKYTYNEMRNNALYEYQKDDAWVRNDNQSFTLNYTEHIAAAYGIVSANLARWSLVAGLRGEYTHTYGKGGAVTQDYVSLFPNANLSYRLTRDGAYSIIAQYARTIERPSFWRMNPRRMQISDYTYQTGNPYLNPSFKQDISLTVVLKHKYSLTAGMIFQTDEIQQTMQPDTDDPDRLQLGWVNFDRTQSYYLSANLPFQLAKWWTLNLDATYMRQGQRIEPHAAQQNHNFVFASASTTFTLPAKFYIDLTYNFQNRIHFGNCWVEPQHRVTAALKKRFGERFTATLSVRSLLDQGQQIGARGEGFVRTVDVKQTWNNRSFQIGITYNFKSGKAFNRKSVEEASGDTKSRL